LIEIKNTCRTVKPCDLESHGWWSAGYAPKTWLCWS